MAKVYWITGLSGVGKTPLAILLQKKLSETEPTILIDGDVIRDILKFSSLNDKKSRLKIAYIYSDLANLIQSQGVNVVCATISLFHEIHNYNREIFVQYNEIFLKKDLDILIKEDKNKIYSKSLNNETKVVGVNIKAEYPKTPSLVINIDNKIDFNSLIERILDIKI